MKVRFKLQGAPLSYALALVPGALPAQSQLHEALWAEDGPADRRLAELVFLRTSTLNACHH